MAHEILLYDEIGPSVYGMLDGAWMASEIKAAKDQPIALRINSPGGSVFEGQAMYTALANHAPGVTAYVDSLAASAASFVMLAAKEIVVAENAFVMVHNAWGFAMGNSGDMRTLADLLDKIDGTLVNQYAARTKNDQQRIRDWMAAETWFTGKEAVDHGFADRLAPLASKDTKACIRPDQFRNAPAALLASARPGPSQRVQAAAMARRLALARALA